MLDHARWHFEQAASKDSEGASPQAAHMRQAAAARGLDLGVQTTPPDLPDALEHLWEWFLDLHGARQASSAGPLPFPYGAILDYAKATGKVIWTWEVKVLKAMDREYLAVIAESQAERRARKDREARSKARPKR